MKDEMDALAQNSTWKLVQLPETRKAISNRRIYKKKRNAEGDVVRYKARLVVRGFVQKEGIDYNKFFSPVTRLNRIRSIISITACEGLELYQFDIKAASLY